MHLSLMLKDSTFNFLAAYKSPSQPYIYLASLASIIVAYPYSDHKLIIATIKTEKDLNLKPFGLEIFTKIILS